MHGADRLTGCLATARADLGPPTPPGSGDAAAALCYGAAASAVVPGVVAQLQAQLAARIVDSRLVRASFVALH